MRQSEPPAGSRLSAANFRTTAVCALALALAACATPKRATPPVMVSPTPAPTHPRESAETALPPAAPAPASRPHEPAARFRSWVAQQERLYRVGGPILLNSTPLCPEHMRNLLGFTAKNKYSYSADHVDEAQTYLGLEERLRITEVLPGSGASLAGIRDGDILLAVEIEPMPVGEHAEEAASSLIASELQGRSTLSLTIMRDQERMNVEVPLTPACAMKIDVAHADEINTYSDGRRVMITRGMLNFVTSDDELAYAIAREVARNVLLPELNHEAAQFMDRLRVPDDRSAPDTGATPHVISPIRFDPNVERLAMYMAARGGYDVSQTGDFWQRLIYLSRNARNEQPDPASLGQLATIAELAKEISAKQAQGMPLVPGS